MVQTSAKNRMERVSKEILRLLSQEVATAFPELNKIMFSIQHIRVSRDFAVADIYCSSLRMGEELDKALELLSQHSKELRHQVAVNLNFRQTPELRWCVDTTLGATIELEKVFRKMKIKDKNEDQKQGF